VLIITLHDKRRLAEKIDFIQLQVMSTAPAREKNVVLPPGSGPEVIITNKAILRFDKDTKEAYLFSYHPGSSVDEVASLTPWDLKVADDVHETEPPREEEIRVLREVLDPHGMIKIYEGRGYV